MANKGMQRKLTVIYGADVQGYSKLMGDDDAHTINTITAYREIIAEPIEKDHGRVVDVPGEKILADPVIWGTCQPFPKGYKARVCLIPQ